MIFCSLLETLFEGQWQVALQLLSAAQSARLADVVSFNSAISCCQTGAVGLQEGDQQATR